ARCALGRHRRGRSVQGRRGTLPRRREGTALYRLSKAGLVAAPLRHSLRRTPVMSILSFLLGEKKKSAAVAKERLQLIIAHERAGGHPPADYLPALQRE